MADASERSTPSAAPVLWLWLVLTLAIQGGFWLIGSRPTRLAEAVERGAARIETRTRGEVSDDTIRKAIRTQRDTLPFWTTLALIGDFVVEPLAPTVRSLVAAVLFSALAALVGRSTGFGPALAENARLQGIWVMGLATALGLTLALGRAEVETSAALFLPPGRHPAAAWVALRQLDAFALLGWLAMAHGAWRRGQANMVVALLGCGFLMIGEASLRIAAGLVLGAGMRLTVLPD